MEKINFDTQGTTVRPLAPEEVGPGPGIIEASQLLAKGINPEANEALRKLAEAGKVFTSREVIIS